MIMKKIQLKNCIRTSNRSGDPAIFKKYVPGEEKGCTTEGTEVQSNNFSLRG
jgi:hypothetical protein